MSWTVLLLKNYTITIIGGPFFLNLWHGYVDFLISAASKYCLYLPKSFVTSHTAPLLKIFESILDTSLLKADLYGSDGGCVLDAALDGIFLLDTYV